MLGDFKKDLIEKHFSPTGNIESDVIENLLRQLNIIKKGPHFLGDIQEMGRKKRTLKWGKNNFKLLNISYLRFLNPVI